MLSRNWRKTLKKSSLPTLKFRRLSFLYFLIVWIFFVWPYINWDILCIFWLLSFCLHPIHPKPIYCVNLTILFGWFSLRSLWNSGFISFWMLINLVCAYFSFCFIGFYARSMLQHILNQLLHTLLTLESITLNTRKALRIRFFLEHFRIIWDHLCYYTFF